MTNWHIFESVEVLFLFGIIPLVYVFYFLKIYLPLWFNQGVFLSHFHVPAQSWQAAQASLAVEIIVLRGFFKTNGIHDRLLLWIRDAILKVNIKSFKITVGKVREAWQLRLVFELRLWHSEAIWYWDACCSNEGYLHGYFRHWKQLILWSTAFAGLEVKCLEFIGRIKAVGYFWI